MTVSLGPLKVFDAVNTFAVPLNLTLACLSQVIRSVRQPTLKNNYETLTQLKIVMCSNVQRKY